MADLAFLTFGVALAFPGPVRQEELQAQKVVDHSRDQETSFVVLRGLMEVEETWLPYESRRCGY